MFASLRFPDGKKYPEILVSEKELFGDIPQSAFSDQQQKDVFLKYLFRSCPNPEVLNYRAELAEELLSSPALETILRELAQLNVSEDYFIRSGGTVEINQLQTVTAFQSFARRFDRFCKNLDAVIPESAAAKRCFFFCRNYGESFAYRELKIKAAEVIRTMGFSYGFSLAAGNPNDQELSVRLWKETAIPQGVCQTANQVLSEFGQPTREEISESKRPYTDMEIAVLTGIVRKDQKLVQRLEDFIESYAAAGTEDVLRLSEEAAYLIAANEIYKKGRNAGYSLCRPQFRKLGFYSEITGLCYPSESGKAEQKDYNTSPLNHITVVCGPDAGYYLNAVGFAHLSASSGGLVFATEAQISPILLLESDKSGRVGTEELNENSLCLCKHLFDMMLPRQEEAAVGAVLLRLAEQNTRSVVRICSKSNLAVIEKKTEGNQLPPCTLLQTGTDRTLEELLQRHKLTEEKEADQ